MRCVTCGKWQYHLGDEKLPCPGPAAIYLDGTTNYCQCRMKCKYCNNDLLPAVEMTVAAGGPQVCGSCIDKKTAGGFLLDNPGEIFGTASFVGIPSGDWECFCWDVDASEFERGAGEKPDEHDSSTFREGKQLYRLYPSAVLRTAGWRGGDKPVRITVILEKAE